MGLLKKRKHLHKFQSFNYIVRGYKKGEEFTPKNLRIIRPGSGLPPNILWQYAGGKGTLCDIKRGTPMNWDFIV